MSKTKRWTVIIDLIDPDAPTMGAEIGVRNGETSQRILKNRLDTHLILVDPWAEYNTADEDRLIGPRVIEQETCDERYQRAMDRLANYGGRYTVLRMPSIEGAKQVKRQSLDYVFVDGLHTYEACLEDCLAWYNKLKPGGWLIVHDYCPHFPAVVRAVDTFALGYNLEGQVKPDDCYIVQKPCK